MRGRFSSSLMKTMSSTYAFRLGLFHFCPCCRLSKYSFFHLIQNSFAKCCTRLQCFLRCLSGASNTKGGGRSTFVFIVNRWLGVNGFREVGLFKESVVSGRLFTIASASHMNVVTASWLNWKPFVCNRDDRTLHTERICRSHTPPM